MLNDITIGPITFHMYGFMIAVGYMTAYLMSEYRARKMGLKDDILWGILVCSILGILVGSRLLYYAISIPQILDDPSILWNFHNGYVVYGGICFGILLGFWYCRRKNEPFLSYFDLVAPAISIGQAFGRIGCFFAGCCYGKETSSVFHFTYTHSDFAPNDIPLIPTQLLSSLGNFLIAMILLQYAKRTAHVGTVGALYLILYSTGRFVIEFFRDDLRGGIGFLSTSQFISIIVFLIGVFSMHFLLRNERKAEA